MLIFIGESQKDFVRATVVHSSRYCSQFSRTVPVKLRIFFIAIHLWNLPRELIRGS